MRQTYPLPDACTFSHRVCSERDPLQLSNTIAKLRQHCKRPEKPLILLARLRPSCSGGSYPSGCSSPTRGAAPAGNAAEEWFLHPAPGQIAPCVCVCAHNQKGLYCEWCSANAWEELPDRDVIVFSILKQSVIKQRNRWMPLTEGLTSSNEMQEDRNSKVFEVSHDAQSGDGYLKVSEFSKQRDNFHSQHHLFDRIWPA